MKEIKIVEYKKTKNHYKVLTDNSLMKHPDTGEWVKSVIYEQYEILGKDGNYTIVPEDEKLTFTREFKDFKNKFIYV